MANPSSTCDAMHRQVTSNMFVNKTIRLALISFQAQSGFFCVGSVSIRIQIANLDQAIVISKFVVGNLDIFGD